MKNSLKILALFVMLLGVIHESKASENNINVTKKSSLTQIKNFRLLSPTFASSGMPTTEEFSLVQQQGYQHIINLIPGDFSDEQQQIASLDMSFEQIAVDWHNPTLADFKRFVALMKTYQQDKVLLHCRLNYRASAFAYLYQTTQLGVDESSAKQDMLSVWQPEGVWLDYIKMIQHHYPAIKN
jgi:protein tyrosine phosphatase (PTP) superfamily phosphohydrolase (DUF442 family)